MGNYVYQKGTAMRPYRKFRLGIISACLLMAISGCVPLAIGLVAGAGGIAYIKGSSVKNIDENIETVHKASLVALKEINALVTVDELNRHSVLIKAENADGQKIQITVDALTEYVSKVSVRVGTVGDPEESRMIISMIEENL
jgi:hypothetical protein